MHIVSMDSSLLHVRMVFMTKPNVYLDVDIHLVPPKDITHPVLGKKFNLLNDKIIMSLWLIQLVDGIIKSFYAMEKRNSHLTSKVQPF